MCSVPDTSRISWSPAPVSFFSGWYTIGHAPTGNRCLFVTRVSSPMRVPLPPASITPRMDMVSPACRRSRSGVAQQQRGPTTDVIRGSAKQNRHKREPRRCLVVGPRVCKQSLDRDLLPVLLRVVAQVFLAADGFDP